MSVTKLTGPIPRADLVGQRFGSLVITAGAGVNKHTQSLWDALCDCGKEKKGICIVHLKNGHTQSCGCLRSKAWQKRSNVNIKDGMFTCSICKQRLPVENRSSVTDRYRCAPCAAEYKHTHAVENADSYRVRAVEYRNNNREHINSRARIRRKTNPAFYLYQLARVRAKKRGLAFTIQPSDVVIPEFCPVLGIRLGFGELGKTRFPLASSPTLDRTDNTKGYVPGNIEVISWRANSLKKDATWQEIKALALWMKRKAGVQPEEKENV